MSNGDFPAEPGATDYEIAEDILTDVMHDLRKLAEATSDPTEQARLQRQRKLYFTERSRLGMRPTVYQRVRMYHDVLAQKLYDGSAVEDGKLKRPFHYAKAAKSTNSPT